jgi:uncharacterized RDD family membrane protein YckC
MDWHYAEGGQQLGPVSEERLLELVQTGSVTPDTLVWRPGMAEWKTFREAGPGVPPPLQNGVGTKYCSSCGRLCAASDLAMFGQSAVCAECKPAWIQRVRQGMTSAAGLNFNYAGFWIRAGAVCIDAIALGAVQGVVFFVMFGGTMFSIMSQAAQGGDPTAGSAAFAGAIAASVWMFQLISLGLQLVYHSFFWTRFGATLGQMALGLKVVKADAGPLPFGLAVGRYLGYVLSGLILGIGFMMAGWDDEKRALHDRLAGTRVIRVR